MDVLIWILGIVFGLLLLCVAVFVFAVFPSVKKPEKSKLFHSVKYAHRGYHNGKQGVPENTLTAFSLAVEKGFGIEFDINLSKDGQAVIMHDNSLKRMCGVDVKITESLYDDIREIKIGGTEQTPPLLSDMLSLVDGRVPLLVEIKTVGGNYADVCKAAFEQLDRYKGDFCVESFDPRVVMWLKKNRPEVVRGQLACFMSVKGEQGAKSILLRNLMLNFLGRPHFVAYKFADRKNPALSLCRLFWADVYFWTIRNAGDARTALSEKGAIIFENFDADLLDG